MKDDRIRKKNICTYCMAIDRYFEIENDAYNSTKENTFPINMQNLIKTGKKDSTQEKDILQCLNCHRYFLYRNWSPGGSDDAFHTYIHESLEPMKLDSGKYTQN